MRLTCRRSCGLCATALTAPHKSSRTVTRDLPTIISILVVVVVVEVEVDVVVVEVVVVVVEVVVVVVVVEVVVVVVVVEVEVVVVVVVCAATLTAPHKGKSIKMVAITWDFLKLGGSKYLKLL